MPVQPMCTRTRRTNAGPALTAAQLRQICDRLTVLVVDVREIDRRITALEVQSDVLAVAA